MWIFFGTNCKEYYYMPSCGKYLNLPKNVPSTTSILPTVSCKQCEASNWKGIACSKKDRHPNPRSKQNLLWCAVCLCMWCVHGSSLEPNGAEASLFVADHHQLHFTTNGLKALRYCEVRIPSLRSTSPPPSQKKSSSNLVIASSMITWGGTFCIKQLANFIVSLTRLTFRASLHKNLPKASNWQNFIQSAKANFISLVLVIG